jgi:hypothetical protein
MIISIIIPLIFCYIKSHSTLNPLTLFKILFYLILYLLAFFKFLLNFTPNIILDNPVIFIIMTISNIITLYIACLSNSNKNINLRENIIHFFNSLKECKFCPVKIKLFLKNIVIHLKEQIYLKFKQLKDNWFSILLTLIIIIFIANMFRQPIFNCLGEDIFNNFPLYMYVMFSSILPTTYIVTILIKWLKTSNLDFSFRLTDLKDKITILSLILLTISLCISYFYIWPLIGFSIIYFTQSKTAFVNLILKPKNIQGLHLTKLMILPGLSVTEVFKHFGSSFTKDEILSTIENSEPNTNNTNPSNEFTKYSHNKWISKEAFTENVEANAEYSRKNIKTPYIPTELFKSYWDNTRINSRLLNNNSFDKDLSINIVLQYFKVDNNFYHWFKGPADLQTFTVFGNHSMMISENNKPLSQILNQVCINNSQPIFQEYEPYNHDPSSFIIIMNKKRISFAMYRPSETLEQNYPFKKGRTFQDIGNPTPNLISIIGLVATSWGVETIPHQNVYKPQLAFYDITNEKHAFAIHMIFKYLSINKFKPILNDNFIQTNKELDPINLTENLQDGDDLDIKMEQNGRLIREI